MFKCMCGKSSRVGERPLVFITEVPTTHPERTKMVPGQLEPVIIDRGGEGARIVRSELSAESHNHVVFNRVDWPANRVERSKNGTRRIRRLQDTRAIDFGKVRMHDPKADKDIQRLVSILVRGWYLRDCEGPRPTENDALVILEGERKEHIRQSMTAFPPIR